MTIIFKQNEQFMFTKHELENSKNKTMLNIKCKQCNCIFTRKKIDIINYIRYRKSGFLYCTRECASKGHQKRLNLICGTCGKSFIRYVASARNKINVFCTNSCSAKYNNKHRLGGCNRSKAEIYLVSLIRQDFPNLLIEENNHKLLPSGYEIDILLPEIKFGIELNGPTHYLPIFGEELLVKAKLHDLTKAIEMQQLKYTLFVLDISRYRDFKKTIPFLDMEYANNINPFIQSTILNSG